MDRVTDQHAETFSNEKEFRLACFGRTFDFMVAHSIFSHASEAQIRTALGEAKAALEPEGFFAATFVEGNVNLSVRFGRWVKRLFS